jgi:hypothetical protein
MRNYGLVAVLAMVIAMLAGAPQAMAAHTRVTNPNAVSLELFGRGLLWTLNYDRVVSDDLVAGIGYGRTPLKTLAGDDANTSTGLLPVYLSYYFMREASSIFATAGASIVVNNDDAKGKKATFSGLEFNSSTPLLPTFGVGFENRGDVAGFLVRVAAYGVIGKTIAPWFGFSMGYSF